MPDNDHLRPMTKLERVIKRLVDILVALTTLIFAAPLMLLLAILIKLDSKGSAFYLSDRVGEQGEIFRMIKFRTMHHDAPEFEIDPDHFDLESYLQHKRKDDERITRVGRFLRRTSLDELPQLINVLKGDMSFVGPRPEMPWIVRHYDNWQLDRLNVPQGITGWWQVNGRSDNPMFLHTRDDIYYIQNYSLLLDLKILIMTPLAVFNGKGAY